MFSSEHKGVGIFASLHVLHEEPELNLGLLLLLMVSSFFSSIGTGIMKYIHDGVDSQSTCYLGP